MNVILWLYFGGAVGAFSVAVHEVGTYGFRDLLYVTLLWPLGIVAAVLFEIPAIRKRIL